MSYRVNNRQCVKFLISHGSRGAVRLACTCGMSHGARSWSRFDTAVQHPEVRGYVSDWVANNNVSRMCRDYAERGTGVETLRGLLAL